MKHIQLFTLLFLILQTLSVTAGVKKLYVDAERGNDAGTGNVGSPLKTIYEAQRRLSVIEEGSEVEIILRDGTYWLNTPLVFKAEDGGKIGKSIRIKAYKNEVPKLYGGYRVENWQVYDADSSIYWAQLPEGMDGRQFFVNGQRAVRARQSDGVKRWIKSDSIGHITSDLSLLKWRNPQYVECVYREIWAAPRCGVASITQIGDTLVRITMQQPGWKNCRNKGITSTRTPWYLENALELLDEAGEWYLDKTGAAGKGKNVLFYKPYSWENLQTAECVFPVLESLIQLEGTKENCIRNISLEGLTLAYTTWLRPSTNRGNPDAQNNVSRQNASNDGESMEVTAAVMMKFAQHIAVDGCTFIHLGGNGLQMEAGCSHNRVAGSLFYDLSATGIQLGNYRRWQERDSEDSYDPLDKRNLLSDNLIENNHVELCGVDYRSATGIAAAFPVSTVFRNNTLKDLPYCGFHIGWGWTTIKSSVNGGNLISRNRVQNVMVELADGGSVYTLGECCRERPSTVTENYLYRTMWGQGVYLDNGSAYYRVLNNVYESIDDYNVKINSGSHDNTVRGIYSNKHKNLLAENCYGCSMDSATIFADGNRKLVERIKKNAGARRSYRSVWEMLTDKHIFELEHAEVAGGAYTTSGIGTQVFDYSGMGFIAGFDRAVSSRVSFHNRLSAGGTYTVALRYSADRDWCGKLLLTVNGKPYELEIQSTLRGEWRTLTLQADFKKGINEVVLSNTAPAQGHLFFDVMNIY